MMTAFEMARGAQQVLAERRRRNAIFGEAQDGFGEPAWEMLLHLVVDEAKRPAMPADELVNAIDRFNGMFCRSFIKWMGTRNLARYDEAADRVQLTDQGREQMAAYLKNARVAA
jgi:hypothetical protein